MKLNLFFIFFLGYYGLSYYYTPPTITDGYLDNLMENVTRIDIDEGKAKAYVYTQYNNTYLYPISKHSDFGEVFRNRWNSTADINYISVFTFQSLLYTMFFTMIAWEVFTFVVSIIIKPFIKNKNEINSNGEPFQVAKKVDVKFDDVIGLNSVKTDLMQIIDYIKNREKYLEVGFKPPKGLLFSGPPGTGKTYLAKALAGESEITFISASGADFAEVFVGVGPKRVRELFELARQHAPTIVFIDEIDSIGRKRGMIRTGGDSEQGNILNRLLIEMDGFGVNENITVIGATNISSVLDPALMRSGRFDRKIVFDPPNKVERKLLFDKYLEKVKVNQFTEVNTQKLSDCTAGLSGADIANIVNQSVATFMKRSKDYDNDGVTVDDILVSVDEVIVGMEKRERMLTDTERERVAFHEAGHSLVAYMLKDTNPPVKTSIIPRGEAALGFSQQEPDDRKLQTYNELVARIWVLYGGMMAEQVKYGVQSTGASDDIEKATKMLYALIGRYGQMDGVDCNQYLGDNAKDRVDDNVSTMAKHIQRNVMEILKKNKGQLTKLAKYLLVREVVTKDDLQFLFGEDDIENTVETSDCA